MNVFVIFNETLGEMERVAWTKRAAQESIKQYLRDDEDESVEHTYSIHETHLEPISFIVNDYFKQRLLTDPTREQSFLFLTSELGEAADAIVQNAAAWNRNNPRNKDGSTDAILEELGDVLMMLIKTSEKYGGNVIHDMIKKFEKKGFKQ